MKTITDRYDASALAYDTWWGPVLRPAARRVLDLVASDGTGPRDILDLGAGTGALALAAAALWPAARVVALDGSTAMLEVAERAAGALPTRDRARLHFVTGLADALPFPDASFDAVVSSFVLQLVPHRPRALAEVRRVLRPGGSLTAVTWLAGSDEPFAPDEAFYDALDECAIPDELEPEEARSGDYPSPEAAAAQLRRAGFHGVAARGDLLVHRYDPATYLRFLEEYAERETFATLTDDEPARVRQTAERRLGALHADAFVWRAPIVYLSGRRSSDRRLTAER